MTADYYPDGQAEQELRQKIAAGSQDPDDYRNLADLLFPSGRYDEMIALYCQAETFSLTGFKQAQLSMELGWIYYGIGQPEQATFFARKALALLSTEPKNGEVLYCLGASQTLLSLNDSFVDPSSGASAARLALEWLEQAIADGSKFRDKPYAYIDAARLHGTLGNMDEAITYCETCLGQEVNEMQRVDCLIVYAQSLQNKERYVEAENAIAEAFRYGKNYKSGIRHTLYMELGAIQRFTNRQTESRKSYEQALAALKSDPYLHSDTEILGEVYFGLAVVCYERAEYQDAISAYSEVLRCKSENNPSYWTALCWLGRSYEAIEDYGKARDCYAEVLASTSTTDDDKNLARRGLMWVAAKLDYLSGKYSEAAGAFEEIVSQHTKEDQGYWLAILWLASCYEGLGDHKKARTYYEDALDSAHTSDANKVIARNGLARSLANLAYESGEYKEAAVKFEEVLGQYPDTDPKHWNTFVWLASCYQGLGNYAKAQECYQKVLASRHSTDHDIAFARKRLTSTMGKACYESRNYPEAIAGFEELLTSCPENDPDRFHAMVWLGYCCHATGMLARAGDCFKRVLASPHASEADKTSARHGLARLQSI